MPDPGLDLSRCRVLLCNDDGIDAPGIRLLERIVRDLAGEMWVVAPEREQSATSHALTINAPLRIRHIDERVYAVDGTPTDAVLLALRHIMAGAPPDLVITGINRGGNIGYDVSYSGTVGAALEAVFCGVPAIALSQNTLPGGEAKWITAESFAAETLRRIAACGWPEDCVVNVNFPDVLPDAVRGTAVTRLGFRKPGGEIVTGRDPANKPYVWISTKRETRGEPAKGSDVAATNEGLITVTPVRIDPTDDEAVVALDAAFDLSARSA